MTLRQHQDNFLSDKFNLLKNRAEELLDERGDGSADNFVNDAQDLLHELQTHQIELELQNEELLLAQQELIKARDQYTSLYEFAPLGYVTIGKNGMITNANLTFAKMLGIARAALVNQLLTNFIHREDQDAYYLHKQKVLEKHFGQFVEVRMGTQNSEGFWVRLDSCLLSDSNEPQIRIAITNISEKKKLEDEVLSYAQHLKLYHDQAPLASIEWDLNSQIVGWSNAAEKMFGYTIGEVKKRSCSFMFSEFTSDNEQNKDQLIIQNSSQTIISKHYTKSGQLILCEWHNSPLRDESGKITGVASLVLDISKANETKQALIEKENEQREILDNMIEGVITIDERGNILTINRASEELFGYSADEIMGKNIKILMPEPPASLHDNYLQNYIEKGEAHIIGFGREVEALHKNKSVFPIRIAIAELPTDASGKRRFVGSCQDLTEQKLQEEKLRRSQKLDALGKLTGGIAHDYNNMIGVILGFVGLLDKKLSGDSKSKSYVDHIRKAAERSRTMTRKLLAFSRQKTSNPEVANINNVIISEKEMLTKCLTVQMQLKTDLCDSLWAVYIDIAEFQNMLVNTAINAKHAIQGEGTLIFRTQNRTFTAEECVIFGKSTGDYVQLSIIDDGMGMDHETMSKIFDPFFSTKGEKGTGLGLSQVFGFIERSEGLIKVNSERGQGTQFDIFFPRYRSSVADNSKNMEDDWQDFSGHESLLVVDDEPALADMIKDSLAEYGYKVLLAYNAEQALNLLNDNKDIALMISDVIMPKIDGFQLVERVEEQFPNIKIQMISGYLGERKEEIKNQDLVRNILYKPFNIMELLRRIRTLLD